MQKTRFSIAALAVTAGLVATMAPATAFASPDDDTDQWWQDQAPAQRVWGERASNTSIEANQALARDGRFGESNEIFIVGSKPDSYPDPLAATPLADCMNIPVFMNSGWEGLDPEIRDAIRGMINSDQINLENITILGGPDAVDPRIEADLKAAFGEGADPATTDDDVLVGRIAGAKAFETSYYLAADAAACYDGDYSEVLDLRRAIIEIDNAEAAYGDALDAYEEARADLADAQADVDAILREIAALQAEIVAETMKLEEVRPWTLEQLQDALDAVNAANEALATIREARDYFVDELGAFPRQGDTTFDIKSTLAEYRDLEGVNERDLQDAIDAVPGVTYDTTLEEAIVLATRQYDSDAGDVRTASEALAEVQADVVAAAQATRFNAPILERIGEIALEIEALEEDLEDAEEIRDDAQAEYDQAVIDLTNAIAGRPAPGARADAVAALSARRDAEVRDAGNNSVYLGTVDYFGDALAAGPAAAKTNGVVLLSDGTRLEEWTTKYLRLSGAQVVAVGGPASAAIRTNATFKIERDIVGATAIETARDVTEYAFQRAGQEPTTDGTYHNLAVASAEVYYDAVIAAPFISQLDGGLLLTYRDNLPIATREYISNRTNQLRADGFSSGTWVWTFGGPVRISDATQETIAKTAAFQ